MPFIKKNFIRFEFILGGTLFCVICLSALSIGMLQVDSFWSNHDLRIISDGAFLTLLILYAPNLFMHWHPVLGLIINALFYAFLFSIPIIGIFIGVKDKEKQINTVLHVLFLILGVIHITLFVFLYRGFVAFMSV